MCKAFSIILHNHPYTYDHRFFVTCKEPNDNICFHINDK